MAANRLNIAQNEYEHQWSIKNAVYNDIVEPRFDEVARDWVNLFVKSRFRYIENLDTTNLRENDRNVRHIEV